MTPRGALVLVAALLLQDTVKPPPPVLGLDPFYKKYLDAGGLPIVSSDKVPDLALREAQAIVLRMTSKRPDILNAMIERSTRLAIMATSEVTTDIPEHRDLNTGVPQTDWTSSAGAWEGPWSVPPAAPPRITCCSSPPTAIA